MSKVKVQVYQKARGYAQVENGATVGATVGVNLLNRDGSLFNPSAYLQSQSNPSAPSIGINTTDDIQEGQYNLYFHDAPVNGAAYARKDGAWSPITGTAGGTVTSVDTGTGITGGPITGDGTISLDSASIDALALALTSLQSITQGNGITVDNADPTHPAISAAVGMGVPYLVASGETYAVPLGIQTLWTIPIELEGTANLDVSGHLVEVA